jgi:hypothetical protein
MQPACCVPAFLKTAFRWCHVILALLSSVERCVYKPPPRARELSPYYLHSYLWTSKGKPKGLYVLVRLSFQNGRQF